MSTFVFRGFIPASSSWVYWKTSETEPDGITLKTITETIVTTSVNFSRSLNSISDLTSSLEYSFEFTNGLVQTVTNVTDSISGFIINGGSDVANGWKPLLLVSGSPPVSHFAIASSNNRKFTASGSAAILYTGSFSAELLVKHNSSIGTNWDQLIGNYPQSSWRIWKQGSGAPNRIRFDYNDQPGTNYFTLSTSSLPLAEWVHIVCTREVTSASSVFVTQSIYINGQLDATSTHQLASPIRSTGQTFYLGGNATTNDNWDGEIAYARTYNKTLSQNEINQTYSSSIGLWQNEWFRI